MKTDKSLQSKTAEAMPQTIGAAILEFQKKCTTVAASQIELTNEARRIGLLVQSWCGHDQMNFQFWENHRAELPKGVSFEMVKTFVAIARRVPDEVEKLEDARRVWQMDFQAAGLLELPERTERQQPASLPRFVQLMNTIGNARNVLADWNRDEPFEAWSGETRQAVAAQLKPLAELYRELTKDQTDIVP